MSDEKVRETYLGDGVYARWDGYSFWLDLRAQEPTANNEICLEPEVMRAFDDFRAVCLPARRAMKP